MSFDLIAAVDGRPYRRWIEGADLSLEANTPSTPTEGVYYVLQGGVVCFSSVNLAEAGGVFDGLRTVYWENLLGSRDVQERLDGARGLFGHDHSHVRALEVLAKDGTVQDHKRVAQAQHRAHYAARHPR